MTLYRPVVRGGLLAASILWVAYWTASRLAAAVSAAVIASITP